LEYTKDFETKAEILKALAHPVRLCIVSGLLEKESCNVTNMEKCLAISQSGISQHLAKLKAAGIITSEKIKNEVYYRIKDEETKQVVLCIVGGLKHG
jgi:DNA-binding transcriptional ArsR family regulator